MASFSYVMDKFVGSEISTGLVEISKVEISGIEKFEKIYWSYSLEEKHLSICKACNSSCIVVYVSISWILHPIFTLKYYQIMNDAKCAKYNSKSSFWLKFLFKNTPHMFLKCPGDVSKPGPRCEIFGQKTVYLNGAHQKVWPISIAKER